MDRQILKIGKPKIIKREGKSSLSADIIDAGERKTLEYCVDIKWGGVLTYERSDAFVVALLYYAMVMDRDIQWEVPCNEQLIYQLSEFYIPVCANEQPFMHRIHLYGPTTKEQIPCEGGVATGISNGVDSCYTIKKFLNSGFQRSCLTHLVFTDCFTTDFSEEYQEDFFRQYLSVLPQCAKELGLKFIFVEFHPDVHFSIGHIQDKKSGIIQDAGLYTLKYCSIAMALQKLLGIYYFSSSGSFEDFSFLKGGSGYYDLFTLPLLSTDAQKFYSSGMEIPRIRKVYDIADWDYAQRHLQVCAFDNDKNCGHCSKCIRTMTELWTFDKLTLYRDRFPVDDYQDKFSWRMAEVLMEAHRGHSFEKDILRVIRKQGKKIPLMSYVLCPLYIFKEFVRTWLRTKRWARRIYRRFHLDKFLYGRSTSRFTQSVDREKGVKI